MWHSNLARATYVARYGEHARLTQGLYTHDKIAQVMPIPDYESIMLPILKFLGDKREHSLDEVIGYICKTSDLSDEEKKRMLPSGYEPVFRNRIRWARWYLEKAGLLESRARRC